MYVESVAAYIRVSTTEQKLHGLSIDAQKMKLAEYAEKHNLHIIHWYMDEGISGRKPIKKRPELQRMIMDSQKGIFSRIIFIKLDRFFRSVAEYHECMKMIHPVVWTATEEKYDLSTANGRAFVNMKITIAELEADQTSERIKLVNDFKVKSGLPIQGTERFPFCYEVAKLEGEKYKSIRKANQNAMIDLIDRTELTGSIRAAVQYVNATHGMKLTYKIATTALHNPLICGQYRTNTEYCDPYISRERFDRLQKIISGNPRTTKNRSYLFSGLLICPECGRRLAGNQHKTEVNGKVYSYNVYRCPEHRVNKTCSFASCIFESHIENQLIEKIALFVDNKKAENISVEKADQVKKHDIEALVAELERLNYAWKKGRIKNVDQYDREYDDICARIAEANAEATNDCEQFDFARIEETLSKGWKDIYNALDDAHKKSFWRSFISEIHLTWGKDRKSTREVTDVVFF